MMTQEAGNTLCALLQPEAANRMHGAKPASFAYAAAETGAYGIGGRITCVDRTIIRRYFQVVRRERIAGGKAKPRTHQNSCRQWQPGGSLPGKLRAESLPRDLEYKLSPLNDGYQRVLVECDVLLIEAATHSIVDVMQDADAVMAPAALERPPAAG